MYPLTLDFRREGRPYGWINAALLALGLAAAAAAGSYAWQLAADVKAREDVLAQRQAKLKVNNGRHLAAAEQAALAREIDRANRVAAQLNLPWELLFSVLEANEHDVALLSVEPEVRKREVVIAGEARNFEEMLAYVRYLQAQPVFSGIALQTHQINQQDRDKPVRFKLTAGWVVQ